jgi:hypothetical protein
MTGKQSKTAARKAREAKALRENLARRKSQSRGRVGNSPAADDGPGKEPSNRHKDGG